MAMRTGTPAIRSQFGPYYESAIRKQLPQREAIGQPSLSASELAGVSYGEVQARYENAAKRQEMANVQKARVETQRQEQEKIDMAKEEAKSKEQAAMITGGVTMMATGAALGTTVGGILAGVTAGSAVPGPGTIIGGIVGLVAGIVSGGK